MWNWIKEISLTIWYLLALAGAIVFVLYILFGSCSACAQGVPLFEVPIQVYPEGTFVPITSYDGINFDRDSYIDKSNETGLHPTFGWTGEYYETGVTHGPVDSYYWGMELGSLKSYNVSKSGSNKIYPCGDPEIPVVPEPSSLCFLLVGALEVLRRRRD